jgi:hypothetical protein
VRGSGNNPDKRLRFGGEPFRVEDCLLRIRWARPTGRQPLMASARGGRMRHVLARAMLGGRFPCPARCQSWSSLRPVLKHGPRSLTYTRVIGRQTQRRNESEFTCEAFTSRSMTPSRSLAMGRRQSVCAETRKMVNYSRAGRSQRKLWWKSEAVLTCKSIV